MVSHQVVYAVLMPTYHGTDLGQPAPAHALTEAAESGRKALLDFARRNPVQLVEGRPKRIPLEPETPAELVTSHPQPWRRIDWLALTGSASTFARTAVGKGADVTALAAGDAVEVRVTRAGQPTIRAWWKAGRTTGIVVGRQAVVPQRVAVLMLEGNDLPTARHLYAAEREAAAAKRAASKMRP